MILNYAMLVNRCISSITIPVADVVKIVRHAAVPSLAKAAINHTSSLMAYVENVLPIVPNVII